MTPSPVRRAARLLTLGAALLSAALGSPAWASPATDLYGSATEQLRREYFGWSAVNLSALTTKYAALLGEKCAPQADACSYDTARTLLTDMLKEIGDAHTNVRDPEGAVRLREVTDDLAVSRTGARTVRAEGGLLVVAVMPGSPAEQGGLRLYDLLTTVNGQAAGKRDGQDAPVGPNDFIRLERAGGPITVTRSRGVLTDTLSLHTASLKARDVPTLAWAGADKRVAVINYPSFLAQDAAPLFLKLVNQAREAGARGLVVDLRFNGGGSLDQCVAAASIFGPVLYRTQYRQGGYEYGGLNGVPRRVPDVRGAVGAGQPPLWTAPAAVLVGPNTASCSEVFTYYAQRAGVQAVGEPTKGVGNSGVIFEPLPDGGVLSVTILRAFTDGGTPLPAAIRPDVPATTDLAALSRGQDTALSAALTAVEGAAASR